MSNVQNLSGIVRRSELEELKSRVEQLESMIVSIAAAFSAQHSNSAEDAQEKPASSFAEEAGVYLGATIDPLDVSTEPSVEKIGREFSIIECPKACIPTKERIMTDFGPMINFRLADQVALYAMSTGTNLKDGPYINFRHQRHDVGLKLVDLTRWIYERFSRAGIEPPTYVDLFTDLIDENGQFCSLNIFKGLTPIQIYGMLYNETANVAPDSGIGISQTIRNLCSKPLSNDVVTFAEYVDDCANSGVSVDYIGLKVSVDVQEEINKDILAINIDKLCQSGVPEIHITNFAVTNNYDIPSASAAAVYGDFLKAIEDSEMITCFSLAAPMTIPGLGESMFDRKMKKTESYDVIKKGFWKMTI